MTAEAYCNAQTVLGPCLAQPVEGKTRCFRHGGAPRSGAPKGSQNAYKHGYYTREDKDERRELNRRIRELNESKKALKDLMRKQRRPQ